MKSITSLPPNLKGLALKYQVLYPNGPHTMEDDVRSFVWTDTKQGFSFWNFVNNNNLDSAYFLFPSLREPEIMSQQKQSLTREQLITLYRSFDCMEWKRAIKPYLEHSIFLKDNELVYINDEDVKRAFKDGSPSQKEALLAAHLKDPSVLPERWEDIKFTGKWYYLDAASTVVEYDTTSAPVRPKEQNLMRTKEDVEALREYIKLLALRDEWREGWVPNWRDTSRKYGVRISNGRPSLAYVEKVSKTFSFPSKETTIKFIETFKEQLTIAAEFI